VNYAHKAAVLLTHNTCKGGHDRRGRGAIHNSMHALKHANKH